MQKSFASPEVSSKPKKTALLITSGSESFPPLRNVLLAIRKHLKIDLNAVWLIDNQRTVQAFEANLAGIKETVGRDDVMIASLEVTEDNASDRIPGFMAQFVLRDAGRPVDVIVDLTAGPKFIASLLYAAANFCRIQRIHYFLLKNSAKRSSLFEELGDDDYEYLELPPFSDDSLLYLSQRSYLELVYYLKEVDDLIKAYTKQSPDFADKIEQSLSFAVRSYFDGDYRGSIRSVGSLLETWSIRVYEYCDQHNLWDRADEKDQKKKQKWSKAGTWDDKNVTLEEAFFSRFRKPSTTSRLTSFDDTLFTDHLLALAMSSQWLGPVRQLRNLCAHSADAPYKPGRDDARLTIDVAFSLLARSADSPFFQELQSEITEADEKSVT